MKNEAIIYWAPATFSNDFESWNMLYREPKSLGSFFHGQKIPNSLMGRCPAVKDYFKNTFMFEAPLDDKFSVSVNALNGARIIDGQESPVLVDSRIALLKTRETSLPGYANLRYNLAWIFFSPEPLEVKLSAPTFPSKAPMKNMLFSPGIMDIGRWFRPVNYDFHVPLEDSEFSLEEGDPLFYIEALTDKKVVFKRFVMSDRLMHFSTEATRSPFAYHKNVPLIKRYQMFEQSKMQKIVLSEIEKNLVD